MEEQVMRNVRALPERKYYLLPIILTTLLGLASRKYGAFLPTFISTYAGDTLWATLVFWLIRVVFIKKPSRWVANRALVFAFSIEISQLYHAPWLDWRRNTTLGSLVLGHGFLWSDLACYSVGVALGFGIEKELQVRLGRTLLR
ncbi:DUF2809 domain-containing protein [Hymenobacter sp. GOD-10R]|uniref:ribosomal maturation YjgA family protein n=1 Tax=Hymenobacter sp. GOD-10R TaxID=3093922 RepID=UPI002D76DF1E|nr:DUF2809 domain-containing protein [Hymenobacter sp. GOD-10R]WRQ29690.1 DUF2809 domain-containing protein [Hymenobacter sp. GOD-10R]